MNLNNLNESGKEALFDAKKRFDEARREATKAFNNEVLTPSDRILAMVVRLMATILEKVENPVSAVAACRSGLDELHLMPFVRENFSVELRNGIKSKFSRDERRQIISSVCQMNRIIYDVALMVGVKEGLIIWPCVQVGDEKVDPLRDVRVVNTLRKLNMEECSLPWSFGQEGKEEQQRLKSAMSIATNAIGHLFVVDSKDDCVKVFDTSGTFLYSFGPSTEDKVKRRLVAVASGRDDNVYLLVEEIKFVSRSTLLKRIAHIQVFDRSALFLHHFTVDEDFEAKTVKLKDNSLLLVPGKYIPPIDCKASPYFAESTDFYAVLCNTEGKRIGHFFEQLESPIIDITAADDHIMVLDSNSNVFVFSNTSDGKDDYSLVLPEVHKFSVAKNAYAITFHSTSGHLIIASKTPDDPSQVSFYSKEGKLECSIELELEKKDRITGATVATNGRICITAQDDEQDKGKVLVL